MPGKVETRYGGRWSAGSAVSAGLVCFIDDRLVVNCIEVAQESMNHDITFEHIGTTEAASMWPCDLLLYRLLFSKLQP